MTSKSKVVNATVATLTDGSVPISKRKALFLQLLSDPNPTGGKALEKVLEAAAGGSADAKLATKLAECEALLEELRAGPLRIATYMDSLPTNGSTTARAHVLLENGDSAYPVLPDPELAASLRRGANVLLDAQSRTVLRRGPPEPPVGEEAQLERVFDDGRIEAKLRDLEPFVFRSAAKLAEKIRAGEVLENSRLLVCSRRAVAFDALPPSEGLGRRRYLARDELPDVVESRDIGDPPPYLREVREHLRTEMTRPALGRKYRIQRAMTKFLVGVSGTGKTLSMLACWRSMYELMAEVTGVPVEALPRRVLRLRVPEVLSKWLGESDKNLDRFFDEVEELACERFIGPDGREHDLPVLALGEEIDGLARARGSGDGVYDRIQATALERFDTNRKRLRDRLVVFLFTSNCPTIVDPGFVRRAGGTLERFDRLGRRGFRAVLEKHLRGLPLAARYGKDQGAAERNLLREVTDWLFSPDGHDPGQVELTYVGSSAPVVKYRRDFLTGALVDRSVQQAARVACRAEREDRPEPGVAGEMLMAAFDEQIRGIVDLLTPQNAENYVSLPEGERVANVRRIEPPAIHPFQLERRRA